MIFITAYDPDGPARWVIGRDRDWYVLETKQVRSVGIKFPALLSLVFNAAS